MKVISPKFDFTKFPPSSAQISNASSGIVKSAVLSDVPCTLIELTVRNCGAATTYVQLHDAASLPADTTKPSWPSFEVAADTVKLLQIAHPLYFGTGLVVACSSTDETLTLEAANTMLYGAIINK